MATTHRFYTQQSNRISQLPDASVDLIVTSPPYPMIEMWDEIFASQNPEIGEAITCGDGMVAFHKMHEILNDVWRECDRVLKTNGFACINIGDATRTINDEFMLYSNHTAIINAFMNMGYSVLPDIHWTKASNSPNKFMGSGMYPAGAYVTYEHEYILVFRKGGKRQFSGKQRELRQKSAYFWEERNVWFSDVWDVKGTSQAIKSDKAGRNRSAAYPFEIPYRLVNMYSAEGDTVLDPFGGLGTTTYACIASNRNSVYVDIDESMKELAMSEIETSLQNINLVIDNRLNKHQIFIDNLPKEKRDRCYTNLPHGFLVKTKQETAIRIDKLKGINLDGNTVTCEYEN